MLEICQQNAEYEMQSYKSNSVRWYQAPAPEIVTFIPPSQHTQLQSPVKERDTYPPEASTAISATAALCTFHERLSFPVCRSCTRSIRLRDADTRVVQSGLIARAVMGSESWGAQRRGDALVSGKSVPMLACRHN